MYAGYIRYGSFLRKNNHAVRFPLMRRTISGPPEQLALLGRRRAIDPNTVMQAVAVFTQAKCGARVDLDA